ncbi:Uncharacterized protein Fot_42982 [Forsythia ovata]|uniref:Uncharacterized protein n=1 Tax=Forsythia ovata TaxID=205694 RepID=A0ABD1RMR0_9LAMI
MVNDVMSQLGKISPPITQTREDVSLKLELGCFLRKKNFKKPQYDGILTDGDLEFAGDENESPATDNPQDWDHGMDHVLVDAVVLVSKSRYLSFHAFPGRGHTLNIRGYLTMNALMEEITCETQRKLMVFKLHLTNFKEWRSSPLIRHPDKITGYTLLSRTFDSSPPCGSLPSNIKCCLPTAAKIRTFDTA